MNFVADESVDYTLVKFLRINRCKVYSIMESSAGTDDQTVLDIAKAKRAVLITEDKDFGELVYRLRKATRGVILLRFSELTSKQKSAILLESFKRHEKEFKDSFTVISGHNIRIRKLL